MVKDLSKEREVARMLLEKHRKVALVERDGGTVRESVVSVRAVTGIVAEAIGEREAAIKAWNEDNQAYRSLAAKYRKLLELSGFKDTPEEWLEAL